MDSQHIKNIQIVAQGFGDLLDDVVFVGAAVAELYVNGPGFEEVRISEDIDRIIEIGSLKEVDRIFARVMILKILSIFQFE